MEKKQNILFFDGIQDNLDSIIYQIEKCIRTNQRFLLNVGKSEEEEVTLENVDSVIAFYKSWQPIIESELTINHILPKEADKINFYPTTFGLSIFLNYNDIVFTPQ